MENALPYSIFTFILSLFALNVQAQPPQDMELRGCHYHSIHEPEAQPLTPLQAQAFLMSESRSDTIDIINYDIDLDVLEFATGSIRSTCNILFTPKMNGVTEINLDLIGYDIENVEIDGSPATYTWDNRFLVVEFGAPADPGDMLTVSITYKGNPATDPSGFGGLDFRAVYAYNLGIGLSSNPYNFGRSWFPCFDNFVERATYDISLTTSPPRRGFAIGVFQGESTLPNGKIKRSYRMDQLLPTYLVGIAMSNYAEVKQIHPGAYGDIDVLLLSTPSDSNAMKNSFTYLGDCIDALEYWFGPYIWGQVGYVATNVGAMEHSTLIAYPEFQAYGGPDFGNNRLMAHELGHHWWGNMISPNHPSDMWFKEGHAEYSAHLFTEWTFGKEAFIEQVMENHFSNISGLHLSEGYLALSGMSYENTYSNHTYYRGASMVHNLRAYLGDSLFRAGTTEILHDNTYTATDAETYRDRLTAATGIDMTSYFDDWIFSPGYAGYAIDSIKSSQNGGSWDVEVFFEQGLRGAPDYHTNCPLEVAFYDASGDQNEVRRLMTNGKLSSATTTLPFDPKFYLINRDRTLLLAHFSAHERIESTGSYSIPYVGFSFSVTRADQPSDVFVNNHWFGADDTNHPDSRTSGKRFWRIDGQFPEGFKMGASIFYNATTANDWEYDLTSETEDSLILAYRPDASVEWSEFPFYSKNILGNTLDGSGIIKVDSFLPGDYVMANGPILNVNTKTPEELAAQFDLAPNPSSGLVSLQGELEETAELQFQVFDINGRILESWEEKVNAGTFNFQKDFSHLAPGIYLIAIKDEQGNRMGAKQLEIIR